jgi:hypothetical protein
MAFSAEEMMVQQAGRSVGSSRFSTGFHETAVADAKTL